MTFHSSQRSPAKRVTGMVVLGVLLFWMANAAPAAATADHYTEDFTATNFMDAGRTNATGWGLGAVRLPRVDFTPTGYCDTPGFANEAALADSIAYVADFLSGLQVIDITNPRLPTLLGGCDTPGTAVGVTVAGGIAYVADDASGLQLIDVTNPFQPNLIGSYEVHFASDVAVSGRTAWVACLNSGLLAIDVLDPSQPRPLSTYATGNPAQSVAVFDGIAYVTVYGEGLKVINVTNPLQPELLSSYSTPGSGQMVAVGAGVVFVADGPSGLDLIDITDPLRPTLLSSYVTGGDVRAVFVADGIAYVADAALGLVVINVTNPIKPMLLGGYDTPGMPMSVTVADGIACIVDGWSGVQVLELQSELGEDFEPLAVAQSVTVFQTYTGIIARATLSCFPVLPTGTTIVFAFSVDDGAHWETVTPFYEHIFTFVGSYLHWRAVLTSDNPLLTPMITSLAISITVKEYVTIDTSVPTSTTPITVAPWWDYLQLSPASLIVTTGASAVIVIMSCMIVRQSRRH